MKQVELIHLLWDYKFVRKMEEHRFGKGLIMV